MQPFRFGLQSVLRIRQRLEERTKQEFSDQLQRMQEQELQVEALVSEQKQVEEKARAAAQNEVDVQFETQCAEYSQALRLRIEKARVELDLRKVELDKRREAWILAQQALKILVKLRERRVAEYEKETQRAEQHFLDEVASAHYQVVKEH